MSAALPLVPELTVLSVPPRLELRNFDLSLDNRVILADVGFTVEPGRAVALLGPNGCGKTSLLRCVSGVWKADRGTVCLDGTEVLNRNRFLRRHLGVVFQEPSLDDKLTARENLVLSAGLYGVKKKEATDRAYELLEFMELGDRANDAVGKLSGGQRRRLEIARALIHRPTMLLLDEPTTGLDPVAAERTWRRLLALRDDQGLSLVIATHNAEEAERCDRLVIMDRGHVVAQDSPAALMRKVCGDVITIEADRPDVLARQLAEVFEVTPRREGPLVLLEVEEAHELIPRLVEACPPGRFKSIGMRRPSLADAFFHLTGHPLTDGELGS